MPPPIRVLVAKPGFDEHDRGAKVIARALRDAGMEINYTRLRQTPEMIINGSIAGRCPSNWVVDPVGSAQRDCASRNVVAARKGDG